MGLCREIYQEGFRIPPVRIMRAGVMERDVLEVLLNTVRRGEEREGDWGAQSGACHTGAERLRRVCARYGIAKAKRAARELLEYSEEWMRAFLLQVPPGIYRAEDFLDNDGISDKPVKIAVAISVGRNQQSRGQGPGPRLSKELIRRVPKVRLRPTVTVDFTGTDPHTGKPFAYYETIAGGMGARPSKHGVSGVHTHMTNSLNTPAEALEYAYPLRVRRYSLRPASGGGGKHRGGDGIVREIEVLTDCEVTLLADRRTRGPWGLAGGEAGAPGKASVIRSGGAVAEMPGKFSTRLRKGERIRIEAPGGGGWEETLRRKIDSGKENKPGSRNSLSRRSQQPDTGNKTLGRMPNGATEVPRV